MKYIFSKLNSKKNVFKVLKKNKISPIILDEPINKLNSVNKIKAFDPDLLISILAIKFSKLPLLILPQKGA